MAFVPPARVFFPPSPEGSPLLARSPLHLFTPAVRRQRQARAQGQAGGQGRDSIQARTRNASSSFSLSCSLFPALLAITLIILCLTYAVLFSLVNQQCDDMIFLTSTGSGRGSSSSSSSHDGVNPGPSSLPSPFLDIIDTTEHPQAECVGICCMTFLARLSLILFFIADAILITFLLCVAHVHTPADVSLPSVQSFHLQRAGAAAGTSSSASSRSSYDICLSYTLLALFHFLCSGVLILLLINQQHQITSTPSFHSVLLFSSYILLFFTSVCIDANCLVEAIHATYAHGSVPGSSLLFSSAASSIFSPNSINYLPPDPETERLLFQSLPNDHSNSMSYYAFAHLPSYIIPCISDDPCPCHQQHHDNHICKDMDEGRQRHNKPHVQNKQQTIAAASAADTERDDAVELVEVSSPDSDDNDSTDKTRVETFDFRTGLVLSTSVQSYYGSLLSTPSPATTPSSASSAASSSSASSAVSSSSTPIPASASTPLLSTSGVDSSLHPPVSSCRCVCAICLSRFHAHEIIKLLPCSHRLHISCLRPWAARRSTCPLCRRSMTETAERHPAGAGGGAAATRNVQVI